MDLKLEEKTTGYIVNVWNPLNFQIHLDIPPKEDLYYDTYQYKDITNDPTPPKEGYVYRCRLKNLQMKTMNENERYHEILNDVINRINRSNGWVIVKICYVDKYKRLIVDMFDPITLENYYDLLTIPRYNNLIEKY